MHAVETFLVLGALVIFTMTTLYLNDAKLDTNEQLMNAEYGATAIGLAQTLIEEAQSMAFDEATVGAAYISASPTGFTPPAMLGPESGEIYPGFDDIDDFDGYVDHYDTPHAHYDISIRVQYADTASVLPDSSARHFLKRMEVTVASIFTPDSIRIAYLFGYR